MSLHAALQKARTCDCQAPHRSRLQLDTTYAETLSPELLPSPSRSGTPSKSSSLISLDPGAEGKRLHNLRTELRSAQVVGFCAGYLIRNKEQRQYLTIKTKNELNILLPRAASLEDLLLKNGGLGFRPEKRYQVASILTSSPLHLRTTPWMAKLDIKKNSSLAMVSMLQQIDHASYKAARRCHKPHQQAHNKEERTRILVQALKRSSSTRQPREIAPWALLRETIELQPFRQRYLRRDGRVGRLADLKTTRE